ncbi:histidine phosphatase family protein [Sneathiella litorea]|uniref:Alpha-ribazole phosphatase n=1 Tax=Sneathiella litorea TaxID=2606216 RepID=A0A6L8W375_9PROT|nr:hypothetical protein [Sneathiella litorea]
MRHAPVNAGKIYGHLDLSADFSDAARLDQLASLLPTDSAVITSDLARCRETARHILRKQGRAEHPIHERTMLREQNFGQWEGKTYQAVEAIDPITYQAFFDDPATGTPEGGESFVDLIRRIQGEVDDLRHFEKDQHLIVVTHAGVIRAIVGLALGMAPERMLSLSIDPLSVTHLTLFQNATKTSWRVNFVNDMNRVRHL